MIKKVHLIPIEHKFAAKASEMYIRSTCLPQSHGSKSKKALFLQQIDSEYDNHAKSKSYKIKEAKLNCSKAMTPQTYIEEALKTI